MTYRSTCWCLTLALLLQGCAAPSPTAPVQDSIIQDGLAGTGPERKPLAPEDAPSSLPIAATASATEHQILSGNRRFVSISPEAHPAPRAPSENGVVFNFTNQSIQAVANIILGDLLKENYSIAPSVTGEVTFSTSKPVDKGDALAILQTLLSWTNNALIRQGDRYLVLPANQAVAGQLVPRMSVGEPGSGLTARLFVLDYLSAPEMQKLLRPFARDNAFLLVDPSRNVLVLAGTQEELDNYQRTIDTFDVNWLKGMSIGVFNLKRARATELTPELNRLFGPDSGTPLAGMLRFLPIERTNAVIAISTQATYLTDVSRWIDTIDQGGGNEPQMYVYDARNLKATDLAGYLRQMYSREAVADEASAQVAPGLRTLTLTSNGGVTAGSATASITGQGALGSAGLPTGTGGSVTSASGVEASQAYALDNGVRITAEKTSNQILVRCRPSEWAEIQSAIQRLDVPPMQVQIETRILEVSLTGSLNLGVQWYLGHLAGNASTEGVENLKGSQGALGSGGAALGSSDALFYSFVSNNLQVALHALETSGNTRVLSAPSLVVMNNQQAQIQVGDNIPISQTTINTNSSVLTTSSVQYIQTGVILDVVPRINPGGLVYMDVQQQVSDASSTTDKNGNPTISTRAVSTQVAVQSGETVLLGGLIKENRAQSDSRVPYLGRVPGLGWLFGNTSRSQGRTELIVLITPKVITGNSQARQVTDEYRAQLQLVQPIR